MRFNYTANKDNAVGRALITALAGYDTEHPEHRGSKGVRGEDGCFEVKLLIDDTELPFDAIIKRWHDAFSFAVRDKAIDLLKEMEGSLREDLAAVFEKYQNKFDNEFYVSLDEEIRRRE